MSIKKHHRHSQPSFYSNKASLKIFVLAGVVIFVALAGLDAQADPIQFDVQCLTCPPPLTPGGPSALSAIQYAANIWGSLLNANYAGEKITIEANFGIPDNGALANGRSYGQIYDASLPIEAAGYFVFPTATANHLALGDQNGESVPEITITFSPDSAFTNATWWYDTDNAPPPPGGAAYYDFATIALHEIAHGLGLESALIQTSNWENGVPPNLEYLFTVSPDVGSPFETGWYYDRYVFNDRYISANPDIQADGFPISVPKEDRYALVTDPPHLIFGGPFARAANSGDFPVLFSPPYLEGDPTQPGFVQGSSVSHLSANDFYGYPNDLMSPYASLNIANHTPSALDLAMLKDVGWISVAPTGIPEPNSLLLLATGTGVLFLASYRRKRK